MIYDCKMSAKKRARFSDDVVVDTAAVAVESHDFLSLESVHPYGALPGGNQFLNHTNNNSSAACSLFRSLMDENDELWMHVLGYCDGVTLANVVQTCCFFYVAGHQPELWRDLLLRRVRGVQDADKGTGTAKEDCQVITQKEVGASWKDTFVNMYLAGGNDDGASKTKQQQQHAPMRVSGVYSDYFYRLHSCRSFAIPQTWMKPSRESGNHTVPRVNVKDMTTERFLRDFENPNRPVLIAGGAKTWKCFEQWQNVNYCLEQSQGREFRATSGVAPLPANFTLEAYLNYCTNFINLEEAPLYLFDRTALAPDSQMWKDYMPDLKRTCPWWDPDMNDCEHDLFQLLVGQRDDDDGKRPDHTWLICGPRRSGSVFHIDPNGTHAWNATICGSKRWLFYPPGVTPPGVHPTSDGDSVALPLSLGEWLLTFWDEHEQRKRTAIPSERPLECTAMPGDVLFVPHGWWHAVINLEEGMNMAITHNYVGLTSNLPNVLRFLREKEDQISGCRDRPESIKPEKLLETLEEELEIAHPEELKEAKRIKDWTCAAWTNQCSTSLNEQQSDKPELLTSKVSDPVFVESLMSKAKVPESASFSFSFL